MSTVFWTSVIVIAYCYFGYPLATWLLARLRPNPVTKDELVEGVSIVFSAWNEQDVIAAKIRNLLAVDYPADKMEILIGSDGSTDNTNAIVEGIRDPRVRFFKHADRRGKMVTINELVAASCQPIIIFNDARQELAPNAVRELVKNFADPRIGCVSGELIFRPREGQAARGVGLYWQYEKFIRNCESVVHSMLGATGAIYAIRRELYQNVPADVVLDDMWIPLHIIKKGYRAVFDGAARAFDDVAATAEEEHRRKTRTLFGNYQLFSRMPEMLVPWRSPVAWQLFSHKLLRLAVPFAMMLTFVSSAALVSYPFFLLMFGLQVIFYLAAFVGGLSGGGESPHMRVVKRICYVPYIFCVLNYSALVGLWRFLGAGQRVTWQKARQN